MEKKDGMKQSYKVALYAGLIAGAVHVVLVYLAMFASCIMEIQPFLMVINFDIFMFEWTSQESHWFKGPSAYAVAVVVWLGYGFVKWFAITYLITRSCCKQSGTQTVNQTSEGPR